MTKGNLKEIHPEFTLKLKEEWEDKGFSEEEVKNGIKVGGVGEGDSNFAHWLKEEKKCTADGVHDSGNIKELKEECKEGGIEKTFFKIEAEVEEKEYQVSESEGADYGNELRKVATDDARREIKRKFFKKKSRELFTKKLANASPLLINLINIEANYYTDGKDFAYNDQNDYGKTWLNNSDNLASLNLNEYHINKLLKKYEDEEELEKAAARRYYEVLGLRDEASIEEVKAAYKKLALEKHPDKNKKVKKNSAEGKKLRKEFNVINTAHQTLGDEHKKVKHDLCLMKEANGIDWDDMWLNRKRGIKFTKSNDILQC